MADERADEPADASAEQQTADGLANEGQRLLCAVPASLAVIAKMIGAGKATVGEWRTGRKVPGQAFRAALFEHYGIPGEAWEGGARAVVDASFHPQGTG